MHARVQFSVLGPVRLRRQGVEAAAGQPRQCAVLASLLLRTGRPVSLRKLVEDVWGDDAPPSAVGSVRTYVYRLRQALGEQGDAHLRLVEGGYLLRSQPNALDLDRFKQKVADAREARVGGDLTSAANLLAEGLEMWRGVPLAGVPGPFAGLQRRILGDMRVACSEEQGACEVERGHYAEAAEELSALLVEHPLRERACGLLMTALYGAGRQSEALAVYHRTSHLLRRRLGVSPSPELREVHEHILSGRFELPRRADRVNAGQSPVLSRAPAQLPAALPGFVGREEEQDQVERLAEDAAASSSVAVCAVGGLPGVGKTAFAIAAAHRLAGRFPDGQLFADLRGAGSEAAPRDLAGVLGDLLQSLGVRPEDLPGTRHARGLMFRGLLARRRVLVVLDDARNTDQLRDLLPGSPGSMALVTSRMQLHTLVATHQALPLTLKPLCPADARSLLARRLGAVRTVAEPEAVERIIQLTGRHPLALANVAARAVYRPRLRLANLADEFAPAGNSALDAFASEDDPTLDVRVSLSWSYRLLGADAASLLRDLSVCPDHVFTVSEVACLVGRPGPWVRQALSCLVRAHLVWEVGPDRYGWHRLVAAYAAELADGRSGSSGP